MDDIQQEIKKYLEERNWGSLRPGNLAKSISIEAAELLENFQWTHPTNQELVDDKELADKVRREVADVFIYSIELCIILDVDFHEVIKEKLEYVRQKYPVDLVKDKGKNYYKIKEQYRKEGKF
jgi:NTP pyrophosphatase (non-canonical NTP hydrolase)